jgi:capsular exopolysaccharide synthesis family protein
MYDFIELRRYASILVKRWWLLILVTGFAAAVGYVISLRQPNVYQSSAIVMVGQSIRATALDSRDLQTSERLALTYADIGRRRTVLQRVVDELNLSGTWQALKSRVRIVPVEGTELLEITVEAEYPEEAEATANEIAHQLILISPTATENQEQDEAQRIARDRLRNLQAKIEAGQAKLDALEGAMISAYSAKQVQELRAEINGLESLMTSWEDDHTQLLIFLEGKTSPNHLTVIEPAQANPHPVRPRVRLNVLLAGVLGFCLAVGLVFLLDSLDNTFKSADDLSKWLGLAPLGVVGRIQGENYRDRVLAFHEGLAPLSEAYRLIRSRIQFVSGDRPVKTLMVTSPAPGEGKSVTVANLGVVMAESGLKTIIVDSDLGRPVQHQIFQVSNRGGLADLLCSPELEISSYLRNTNVENLQLITCGSLPASRPELLGSRRVEELLDRLKEMADVVIFDSPPVLTVADAAVLSKQVDGVVLVTYAGRTGRELASQAVLDLQGVGANLLGAVLNGATNSDWRRRHYYYQYYTSSKQEAAQPIPAVPRQWRQWLSFLKSQ